MSAVELQLDGLVGPTHHYGALGPGNVASLRHGGEVSNPRAAALEGLAKMKLVADLGVPQGVFPPHSRPDVGALRRLGFHGSDAEVLAVSAREAPGLLSACSSASAMWAANAATVSPAADTADGRVHFTPANFATELHRSLEPPVTAEVLRRIFSDPARFVHHEPLPACAWLADEGAANHLRLAPGHGEPGLEVFVYGRRGRESAAGRFPARQTLEASEAVARAHGVTRALFVRQSRAAIDAGAFHDDVVAVADRDVLVCHEAAFAGGEADLARIREAYRGELVMVVVPERELSLDDAVASYLFNSQLLTVPSGKRTLLYPEECDGVPAARNALARIGDAVPDLLEARPVSVRQSMRNGGGPACLRLRVVLDDAALGTVPPGVLLDDALYGRLVSWVERHYRDCLTPADLADPLLLEETRTAVADLPWPPPSFLPLRSASSASSAG